MDLNRFVEMQIKNLERVNNNQWRAAGEPKFLSGDQIEEMHFKPQRRATRNLLRATVNVILNQYVNNPDIEEALKKLSESRWKLHFQMAFYKAKRKLERSI